MNRIKSERTTVVHHEHKTVRRQFVDVQLPRMPLDDEEAFVIRFHPGEVSVSLAPGDYIQFIAVLRQAAIDAGMEQAV